jgi:hypothetical protein
LAESPAIQGTQHKTRNTLHPASIATNGCFETTRRAPILHALRQTKKTAPQIGKTVLITCHPFAKMERLKSFDRKICADPTVGLRRARHPCSATVSTP